jgi:cytochrome c-type biogenesis protein CcsB
MKHRVVTLAVALTVITALVTLPTSSLAQADHEHVHTHAAPRKNFLSPAARDALAGMMIQDFQGRMKPFDTLSRESAMKITKKVNYDGWQPEDLYLSWMVQGNSWFAVPFIAVRHPGLKAMIGASPQTRHVTPNFLLDQNGRYRLVGEVDKVHRMPAKERSKAQTKLLSLDERVNVFNMVLLGLSFRVFPVPGDENHQWISPGDFDGDEAKAVPPEILDQYRAIFSELQKGVQNYDNTAILHSAQSIRAMQAQYGAKVLPSATALAAEMQLNKLQPFTWVTIPYLLAFVVLMAAYAWSLGRMRGKPFRFRHPLYALGLVLYAASVAYTLYGYILRWVASGRAPLSNGYESLIFISLMIGIAGLYYEIRGRHGAIGSLGALLTAVMLGVAMLPTFDPSISPLVPVLASFWLIIHVSVITASYGFLGLAAVMAMAILILHLFKGPGHMTVLGAIYDLDRLHWNVLLVGTAFLSVGTFLGGVWANESWGRYWGWDPKETWALVTILVYAFVIHLRFVPRFFTPLNIAAGSFLGISSVGMTYFGVNYFLSGLHSYAQGDAPSVPGWVYVMGLVMVMLVMAAFMVDDAKSWEKAPAGKRKRST